MISASGGAFDQKNDNNNNIIDRNDGTYDRMITWTNHQPEEAFVQITTTIMIIIAMVTEKYLNNIVSCLKLASDYLHKLPPWNVPRWSPLIHYLAFLQTPRIPILPKNGIYQRQYLFDVQRILFTLATMLAVYSPQNPQDLLCRESSQNHRTHRRWPSWNSNPGWWRE